jgi:hypothetical protein
LREEVDGGSWGAERLAGSRVKQLHRSPNHWEYALLRKLILKRTNLYRMKDKLVFAQNIVDVIKLYTYCGISLLVLSG